MAETAGELMDFLATQPRDRKIVMSKDGEGNSFSPLAESVEAMYVAETTWYGEIYTPPEVLALNPESTTEEDEAPEDAERVVLLWPTN